MLFTLHSGFLRGKRRRRLDKLSLESQQAWRSFGASNFFWVFKIVKQNNFFNTTEGNEVTQECCSSANFFSPSLKHPLVWTWSTGTLYSPEKQLESAKPLTFFNPTVSNIKSVLQNKERAVKQTSSMHCCLSIAIWVLSENNCWRGRGWYESRCACMCMHAKISLRSNYSHQHRGKKKETCDREESRKENT